MRTGSDACKGDADIFRQVDASYEGRSGPFWQVRAADPQAGYLPFQQPGRPGAARGRNDGRDTLSAQRRLDNIALGERGLDDDHHEVAEIVLRHALSSSIAGERT